ncbi:hypothetical protein EGW08_021802 [Elysia chlorotica]|uniref:MD-2-related lipid-recognition domain-containing protein n=1 Tax=Elysia chlorotica TaxID=188477 RepID=A0A433SML0_ELYCH|nr:hypothetical protein EGW08_021802 [Elysia chlorotica]
MERSSCLVIVLAMVAAVFCEGPIKVSECGVEDVDNKLVDLVDYSVSPDVVPVPGNFSLSLNLNLNRDLVNAQLDVEAYIKKKVTFFYAPIPCIKEVGSWVTTRSRLRSVTAPVDSPSAASTLRAACETRRTAAGLAAADSLGIRDRQTEPDHYPCDTKV